MAYFFPLSMLQYLIDNRQIRHTLSEYPVLTLAEKTARASHIYRVILLLDYRKRKRMEHVTTLELFLSLLSYIDYIETKVPLMMMEELVISDN
jgi:hypothetical protein